MTEQPTTPEQPVRPMPRLGHGVHWPAIVAGIDRDHRARTRDAEPVNGLTDHSSTPSLGAAGSSLGVEAPVVDVTKPGFGIVSIAEARSWGIEPPPAVELLAMADDLNAHGGLDETFVAGLLRQVADDNLTAGSARWQPVREVGNPLDDDPIAAASHQLGIVRADETMPGGIVEIRRDLTVAEYEEMRARWERAHAGGRPVKLEIIRPRPWWRRTLDRVRRWTR